jgi:enterochelin esterase-like enzyme
VIGGARATSRTRNVALGGDSEIVSGARGAAEASYDRSEMRRILVLPLVASLVLAVALVSVDLAPGPARQVTARAAGPPPAPPLPPGTPRGTLRRVVFRSPALGRRAAFQIYLPAGYQQAVAQGARFPVLYLLHPPHAPRDFLRRGWLVEQADRLMASGAVRPMLLVLPLGDTHRFHDDTEWANAGAGRYQGFVLDVVHAVDRRFATLARRDDRGLAGVSEGGYGALNIGLHRLGDFSVLESWSGYFREEPTAAFTGASAAELVDNSPADYVGAVAPQIRRLGLRAWIYQGEKDQEHPENLAAFSAELARAGAEVHWGYFPGGHSWALWRREIPRMLRSAGAWFARGAAVAHRGALVRVGGQPAPWNSYYHFRGHRRRG